MRMVNSYFIIRFTFYLNKRLIFTLNSYLIFKNTFYLYALLMSRENSFFIVHSLDFVTKYKGKKYSACLRVNSHVL